MNDVHTQPFNGQTAASLHQSPWRRVSTILVASMVLMAILLFLMGLGAYIQVRSIQAVVTDVLDSAETRYISVRTRVESLMLSVLTRDYILDTQPEGRARIRGLFDRSFNRLDGLTVKAIEQFPPEHRAAVEYARTGVKSLVAQAAVVMDTYDQEGRCGPLTLAAVARMRALREPLLASIRSLEDIQTDRMTWAHMNADEVVRNAIWMILAGGGFILAVALLIGVTNVRLVIWPLTDIRRGVESIAQGQLDRPIKIRRTDEFGGLAQAFNDMAAQLREVIGSLERLVAERTADLSDSNVKLQQEVIDRKQAEARQAELLKQLRKTNNELKDFAYVVSHDLKAPLRGVKVLVDWILSDYSDKFDEEGKEQIQLLIGRVNRMHNLIDGILQYSRIGRVSEDTVEVDLKEFIPDLIDTIAPPDHVNIAVENELPSLWGEPTRIGQVFQNLLSNAVKYMDKPEGRIRVGCVEDGDYWRFSVSDNGPGIPEQYHEQIFKLFQTLAPHDGYESTGIGLTLVKKIVEMYGGRVWLTSEVGRGTTFWFTYPKHLPNGVLGVQFEEERSTIRT